MAFPTAEVRLKGTVFLGRTTKGSLTERFYAMQPTTGKPHRMEYPDTKEVPMWRTSRAVLLAGSMRVTMESLKGCWGGERSSSLRLLNRYPDSCTQKQP